MPSPVAGCTHSQPYWHKNFDHVHSDNVYFSLADAIGLLSILLSSDEAGAGDTTMLAVPSPCPRLWANLAPSMAIGFSIPNFMYARIIRHHE